MSILLWGVHCLILRGVRTASAVNLLITIAKIVPLMVFLVAIIAAFKLDIFSKDLWGLAGSNLSLGAILHQVKEMMIVTVWVFIGIEGAVVFSGRAKQRSDVVKATFIGFAAVLALYVLMTVLAFGVATQPELAGLKDPAMALLLEKVVGPWGAWLVNIGLIIAVLGGWLAWTMFAAELPYQAAKTGAFPAFFAKENKVGVPKNSLLVTNALVQLFILTIPLTSGSVYNIGIAIATSAILVPYALTAFYQLKYSALEKPETKGRAANILIGVMASVYSVWLVYAAGVENLLVTVFLYVPGIVVYGLMRKQQGKKSFTTLEWLLVAALLVALAYALFQLLTGGLDKTLGITMPKLFN